MKVLVKPDKQDYITDQNEVQANEESVIGYCDLDCGSFSKKPEGIEEDILL